MAKKVKYTGTENPFVDRIYASGLTFTPNEVRELPDGLAAKFLSHSDVFEVDAGGTDSGDTNTLLAAQETKLKTMVTGDDTIFAIKAEIDRMDKKSVTDWAENNYRVKLDKRKAVRALQDEAKELLDQFGAP